MNSDRYEFVLLSLHSFYAFTWDWPKNELRAVCLRVGRWPDTSYLYWFETILFSCETEMNLRPGP